MDVKPRNAFDAQMMDIALRMAERGLGQTAPNPSVGAVIADPLTGDVIARATTARGGRPHAETQAIALAGSRAKGATIYVTLEPCSHYGHTGPCSDAIIASGLKRVVVATEDPDPRVAGRGLDRLRAAGIDVVRGVGANAARWITRGHIVRITERRPLVTLKLALNGQGEIARGEGDQPVFVTGANARAHGHLLRSRHDAILVGSGTVRDDNPELTCRLPGLDMRSPIRVVLSRALAVPLDSKVMKRARYQPVMLMTSAEAEPSRREALAARGADIITVTTVQNRLWLPAVMEALVARGITRLLVEGGPSLWRSFADASLVDEVALYLAPDAGASNADETHARHALQRWLGPVDLMLAEKRHVDPDTLWRFRRNFVKART
ncbi:MAG: bifunctional diaminohydroxyphosphoribosylaminopyrimidine deaminase/5-amino-6-(5-phosphoribosylamino)uracil reductase RibD [Hyphomicrobium sp.]